MPGWRSPARISRSRSRSQASARQLREAKRGGSIAGSTVSSGRGLAGTTINSIGMRSGGGAGASTGVAGNAGLGALIGRADSLDRLQVRG